MPPRQRNAYGQPLPAGLVPISQAYQRQIALGAPPGAQAQQRFAQPSSSAEHDPRFEQIPAVYTTTITLGGTLGATQTGSVQLRPELFVLKRITWAAQGDVPPYADVFPGFSIQGRAVTVKWSDEFTKFMGNSPALLSAVFGDSQGFLDLPRGALFQGSQSLSIELTRLFWPANTAPVASRFDFVFQGVGLLPKGVAQSGSAG